MTGEPEGLTAVLLQLAGITQKLAELDQRQASGSRELQQRVTAIAALASELKATTASHAQALAALDGLDRQVADLAATAASHPAGSDGDAAAYQPPAHRGSGSSTARPARRPSAGCGPGSSRSTGPATATWRPASAGCWEQHPLCLYILDWLSELWSVLYLAPARTQGTLAGQAEWHTRLLAAAAGQLARETRGCAHDAAHYRTAATGAGS